MSHNEVQAEQPQTNAAQVATSGEDAETAAAEQPKSADWPLFYRSPTLLSSAVHASWRIKPSDVGFAEKTNSIPVVIGEFGAASRSYPLVFAGPDHTPVAIVGLQGRNRFIKEGVWQAEAYVPAYVRRYPFVFAQVDDGFALAIDTEAENVVKDGDDGQALFEDGKPSQVTQQAMQFCDVFTREHAATQEFVKLLAEQDLLVERTANVKLPNGSQSTLGGFSVVAADVFATLPESVVVEWHRKGWLALVHAHMMSMARFTDLLAE